MSSVTGQDLLLFVLLLCPVLLYGGGVGHWCGFAAVKCQGYTWGMDSRGFGLTGRGAGQTNWIYRLLPGRVRRGGDQVLEEEMLKDATVPDT